MSSAVRQQLIAGLRKGNGGNWKRGTVSYLLTGDCGSVGVAACLASLELLSPVSRTTSWSVGTTARTYSSSTTIAASTSNCL